MSHAFNMGRTDHAWHALLEARKTYDAAEESTVLKPRERASLVHYYDGMLNMYALVTGRDAAELNRELRRASKERR